MKQAFGSAFIDVRAQSCLFGLDQVGSLMSSWNTFRHWCNQRAFLGEVKGVYFLRADVALLSEGLHQWPRDRLCFLWKTSCQKLAPNCVNDIIFYVPSTLFHCFREALSQAKEDHMPTDAHRPLALAVVVSSLGRSWQIMCDHVWLEYNFTHPANTSKTANPRYRITGPAPRCQIQSPCCPSPRCQVTP